MSKSNLGRGLSQLMDENELVISADEKVIQINLTDLKTNPDQPRIYYDEKKLHELKESIMEYGLMQPIIVKPVSKGYMIIAGERRFKASLLANKQTIPAVVRDYNAQMAAELALIENIQREDLTSVEEAATFKQLVEDYQYTHAQLAKKIGKSRSYVTNIIGLLHLPVDVIELVLNRKLSMGHARILSKLNDFKKVRGLAEKIVSEHWSVRDLENHLSNRNQTKTSKAATAIKQKLNLKKANIKVQGNKIILGFQSNDALDEFIEDQINAKR